MTQAPQNPRQASTTESAAASSSIAEHAARPRRWESFGRFGFGLCAAGFGLAAMAWALGPSGLSLASQGTADPSQASRVTTLGGGISADSNRDMIAVTGVDVTGVSVLYLIDTKSKHLAVYQASGGSGGTQGVKLVGARDISLDLQLEGFNDKTEYKGRPLRYKDLEKRFSSLGSEDDSKSSDE